MSRLSLGAAIVSLLLLLTAFTVPLIAPLRASSVHLPAALAILLVGAGLAALVVFSPRETGNGQVPPESETPPAV